MPEVTGQAAESWEAEAEDLGIPVNSPLGERRKASHGTWGPAKHSPTPCRVTVPAIPFQNFYGLFRESRFAAPSWRQAQGRQKGNC